MSYAILRTRKISTPGQMSGMQRHNDRTNNVKNADTDLTHLNHTYSQSKTGDLRTDIENRIALEGVKTKKNSVLAIEHLITFSPDFVNFEKRKKDDSYTISSKVKGDAKKWDEFKKSANKWLIETYGKGNIVNMSIHYDEKTPHIHAYVVPIVEKEKKWKNKAGEGVKTVSTLCARDYLGGKDKMRAMQDNFHSAVEHLGLERGKKGSVAKHEHVQKYYERVNEANKVEKDIQQFQLKEQNQVQLSDFPLFGFGREEWKKDEEIRINSMIETARSEAVEEFKAEFEGEIERTIESRKEQSNLRGETRRLSKDVSQANDKLVLERKRGEEGLKKLRAKDKTINAWKETVKEALINQNPKAHQKLLNAVNPPEQKQSKGKGI